MNRSDCDAARRRLEDEWDGVALAPADAEALGMHLGQCAACAAVAADMHALLSAARELGAQDDERPAHAAPLVVRSRSTWRPFVLGALASAAIAAVAVLGLRPGDPAAPAAAGEVVVRIAVPLPAAHSVSVLGDFTGWRDSIPLRRDEHGVWVGELRVKAGRYRYVVIVDGTELLPDPASPQLVDDGFGGKNSILDVASSI